MLYKNILKKLDKAQKSELITMTSSEFISILKELDILETIRTRCDVTVINYKDDYHDDMLDEWLTQNFMFNTHTNKVIK